MMSITLWLLEGYYYYNLAIVIMSVFGISSSIVQTRTVSIHTRYDLLTYRPQKISSRQSRIKILESLLEA